MKLMRVKLKCPQGCLGGNAPRVIGGEITSTHCTACGGKGTVEQDIEIIEVVWTKEI